MSVVRIIAFVLLCALGGVGYLIVRTPNRLRTSRAYHAAHLAAYVLLVVAMWRPLVGAELEMLPFYEGVILSIIPVAFHIPFLWFVIPYYMVDLLPSILMSDHRLRMPKTYDRAEKAEKAKDFALAAQLYREAIAQDPDDLEARRRLAEASVTLADYDTAVSELVLVLAKSTGLEQKALVAVRLAEILATHKRDRTAALEHLYRLRDELNGTKQAELLQARIDALTGQPR
jgi:tetratricopeptide (TPR) repeat protein